MEMYHIVDEEERKLNEAMRKRNEALTNGNSRIFYKLSEELGMLPETQYEKDLYGLGSLEHVSEKLTGKEQSRAISKAREREKKDSRLIEAIDSAKFNFYSSENSRREKETMLREILGYRALRTGKGVYTPLEECKAERINAVLKREYDAAVKRRGQ